METPAPPDWIITRPRLMERLTRGARGPLTVVVGPPGAGKSVVTAAWAASDLPPGPVALASLRDVGDDRAAFWARLRAAGAGDVAAGEGLAVPAGRAEPRVLVLDDVQDITGAVPGVGLLAVLGAAGPALRVVLVSRRDPPVALHRFRMTGALTEIGPDDLAFNDREARALLAAHGLTLSGPAVRTLRDRTEGWATGLRLAAMAIVAGRSDFEHVAREFDGDDPAVMAHLAAEILDPRAPEERRLMLALSIADRFDAALAVALTGPGHDAAFPALVRDTAFIRPLGHGWYRYHRMLRGALRRTLRHELPSEVPVLHRRAAAWFGRNGMPAEAVAHAVLSGDWPYASWLLVDGLAVGAVLGLTGDAPPDELLADFAANAAAGGGTEPEPVLVAAAVAAARGDDTACADQLGRAETLLAAVPGEPPPAVRLAAGLIRLCRPSLPPQPALSTLVAELDGLLDRLPSGSLRAHPEIPALVRYGRGIAELRAGHPADATETLRTALTGLDQGGDLPRRRCLGTIALAEALRGRFGPASSWAARAARITEPPRRPVPAAHLAQAWTALLAYRINDARRSLDAARRALDTAPDTLLWAVHGLVSARADTASGRPGRVPGAVAEVRAHGEPPAWLDHRLLLAAAEAHTAAGDPAAALDTIRDAGDATGEARVAIARARIALGDPRAADTLRPALVESAPLPADLRVEAWVLDAGLAYAGDDPLRGRRSLDRALRLGERAAVRLPFAAACDWLPGVLRGDPELHGPHRRFLDGVGPPMDAPPCEHGGIAPHDALSAREIEVLRLLSGLRTSEEIAAEMYVSVNTVKTHLRSIYRKLAVTRRGDAVRRARHLKLL